MTKLWCWLIDHRWYSYFRSSYLDTTNSTHWIIEYPECLRCGLKGGPITRSIPTSGALIPLPLRLCRRWRAK
jgi:hypothetical protein